MPKTKRFAARSLKTIKDAADVVKKYNQQGKLTLMQIHGILVESGKAEDGRASYKRLQTLISDASKCGLFDKSDIAGRYHGTAVKKNG